jgi:Tfp pilus assembly protein PilF
MLKKVAVSLLLFMFAVSPLFSENGVLQKAMSLANENKCSEAIGMINEYIEKNPDDSDAYLGLGIIYLQENEFNESESNLEKSLAVNPDSVPAYYTLAMLYEKQKDSAKAKEMWGKVVALSQDKELKGLAEKHLSQLEHME